MPLYTKQFTKPYSNGYVDRPQKTTPVTADILNMQDDTLAAVEDFLTSDDACFKDKFTVGTRDAYAGQQGARSLTVGEINRAQGENATAFGLRCTASGRYSHAEGDTSTASGDYAHAEGQNARAAGRASHVEGVQAEASGASSHAEGQGTTASGNYSHAEGATTKASNMCAHAEGSGTNASGNYAHAEGAGSHAGGDGAHAEGAGTIASGGCQHAQGRYNVEDTENTYAHIVGGGTYQERKNIHTLDWGGNAWYAGDVTNGNGVSLDGLMALVGTTGQLRTIVETLPETDISTDTIYMVPKESGGENDIYNEYINVDGTPESWEFIGNSAVDLSNYYVRDQVDQMLAGYVPAETGKELSSNDYTDADLEIVESIRNMTAAGALAILNETEGEAQ